MDKFVTFHMPTIEVDGLFREKYLFSEILGINKYYPVYGNFTFVKKILEKVRMFKPLTGFNWKRNYINTIGDTLTVDICTKNLSEKQVTLILEAGEDIFTIETPEGYKNF